MAECRHCAASGLFWALVMHSKRQVALTCGQPTPACLSDASSPPRRLGNTPVVVGNENPVCSQGQTLASRNTLPIQCTGPGGGPALGRFLTLYRKINQASDMYICQVLAFLSGG